MAQPKWTSWKLDLGTIGGGMLLGGVLGGSMVGLRHLNAHIDQSTPDAPADYVTMMGAEYNRYFAMLRTFCKTRDEKSFCKTLRHRLSRLIKLFHNDDGRHSDTAHWSRLGEVATRVEDVFLLLNNLQYSIKARHDGKSIAGFDDAILALRGVAEDIHHDNVALGYDK
jgi:hypothetical protein